MTIKKGLGAPASNHKERWRNEKYLMGVYMTYHWLREISPKSRMYDLLENIMTLS